MENKNNNSVCCLRCGCEIEQPEAGRPRELCFGCKCDLMHINLERVIEFANNNGAVNNNNDKEAAYRTG